MKKKKILSLKDDRIHENIACAKGVLELIFAGVSGDFASIDTESVQMLIIDAEDKLDEVKEALLHGA
jgi:hypothetical protein